MCSPSALMSAVVVTSLLRPAKPAGGASGRVVVSRLSVGQAVGMCCPGAVPRVATVWLCQPPRQELDTMRSRSREPGGQFPAHTSSAAGVTGTHGQGLAAQGNLAAAAGRLASFSPNPPLLPLPALAAQPTDDDVPSTQASTLGGAAWVHAGHLQAGGAGQGGRAPQMCGRHLAWRLLPNAAPLPLPNSAPACPPRLACAPVSRRRREGSWRPAFETAPRCACSAAGGKGGDASRAAVSRVCSAPAAAQACRELHAPHTRGSKHPSPWGRGSSRHRRHSLLQAMTARRSPAAS